MEDEWQGQPSSTHYTIGLVSDYPTITVHTGKRLKALTDSAVAFSLACISVYITDLITKFTKKAGFYEKKKHFPEENIPFMYIAICTPN